MRSPVEEAQLIARLTRGRAAMVEGAGRYPHVEFAEESRRLIVEFAREPSKQEASGAA